MCRKSPYPSAVATALTQASDSVLREASPDAIILLDAEGRVREWNASAEVTFGYLRRQVVGRDISALIFLGDDRGLVEDLVGYARTGESAYIGRLSEIAAVRADGLEVTVEMVALALPDGTGYYLHMRDVTERKRKMATYVDFYEKIQPIQRGTAAREAALASELDLAKAIQQAALPVEVPCFPGWEIGVRHEFAREVGGDFYLFLPGDGYLDVIVGDVSGKGIPAALTSTSISHLLPWCRKGRPVASALSDLNDDLRERLPADQFVTMVLAELDLKGSAVHLWNAGHTATLLRRADTGECLLSEAKGSFLGVFDDWDGDADTWHLEPGDVTILCTDGVIEARSTGTEEFGIAGVARVVERTHADAADEIAEAILEEVRACGPLRDDATVVACKRIG